MFGVSKNLFFFWKKLIFFFSKDTFNWAISWFYKILVFFGQLRTCSHGEIGRSISDFLSQLNSLFCFISMFLSVLHAATAQSYFLNGRIMHLNAYMLSNIIFCIPCLCNMSMSFWLAFCTTSLTTLYPHPLACQSTQRPNQTPECWGQVH